MVKKPAKLSKSPLKKKNSAKATPGSKKSDDTPVNSQARGRGRRSGSRPAAKTFEDIPQNLDRAARRARRRSIYRELSESSEEASRPALRKRTEAATEIVQPKHGSLDNTPVEGSDDDLAKEIKQQQPKPKRVELDEERIDEMVTLFDYDRAQLTAVLEMQIQQKNGVEAKADPQPVQKTPEPTEDVAMHEVVPAEKAAAEQSTFAPVEQPAELSVPLTTEVEMKAEPVATKEYKPLSVESASENVVIGSEMKTETPVKAEETEAERQQRELMREIAELEQRVQQNAEKKAEAEQAAREEQQWQEQQQRERELQEAERRREAELQEARRREEMELAREELRLAEQERLEKLEEEERQRKIADELRVKLMAE
jgi:hypothetical protein